MASTTRSWSLGAAGAAAAVVVGGWFLLIAPQRSEAADLRDQTVAVSKTVSSAQTKLDELVAQSKGVGGQKQRYERLRTQIPMDQNLTDVISSVNVRATLADVDLVSVSPAAPRSVAHVDETAPVAAASAAPSSTGTGLQITDVSLSVKGDFFAVQDFLRRLEALDRSVLVTGVGVKSDDKDAKQTGQITATISAHIFSAPGAAPTADGTLPTSTGSSS